MELVSGDLLSCSDYCIYDSGHNCLMCHRLYNTEYINNIIKDKLDIINNEVTAKKYSIDSKLVNKTKEDKSTKYLESSLICCCPECIKYIEKYITNIKLDLVKEE